MKLWGGRFSKDSDPLMEDFHSSISFDKRLYREDIEGSIAHATMLGSIGVLDISETKKIVDGLKNILEDIDAGKIEFSQRAEDIHMNVETILTEKIGVVAKKLHTGRSRNDQVATDLRLYGKKEIILIEELISNLIQTLLDIAIINTDTIMPGYTHMQKAQPITLAHHMMAYVEMFRRDYDRLVDAYKRMDVMPLGSGALAGTTFPLDRELTRKLLDFSDISQNSLDGVSDRDYVVEIESACSLIMMHLSRLSEEIIIWSTDEFKFITLDDAYSTGSSIMPQKKNPDVAELIRGKSGRVFGHLVGSLTMLKGLPLAYNKDMQEDKEAFFDTVDTVKKSLLIISPMLGTMKVNKDKMLYQAARGFTNATDAADYLAKKGIPFREAHSVIGKMVTYCLDESKSLDEMTLEEYKKFSDYFEKDIYQAIDLITCVNDRSVTGGPAIEEVKRHINKINNWLEEINNGRNIN
ncbi:MAG: argininosuccinate lyase [Fusobacteria bacterium]|nr:MAG: argininosuccinate lyase [Fusobacteriota bacterium]KAF0228888.1 MAG: argininosuccinate [Fusobacteriota bacterium]